MQAALATALSEVYQIKAILDRKPAPADHTTVFLAALASEVASSACTIQPTASSGACDDYVPIASPRLSLTTSPQPKAKASPHRRTDVGAAGYDQGSPAALAQPELLLLQAPSGSVQSMPSAALSMFSNDLYNRDDDEDEGRYQERQYNMRYDDGDDDGEAALRRSQLLSGMHPWQQQHGNGSGDGSSGGEGVSLLPAAAAAAAVTPMAMQGPLLQGSYVPNSLAAHSRSMSGSTPHATADLFCPPDVTKQTRGEKALQQQEGVVVGGDGGGALAAAPQAGVTALPTQHEQERQQLEQCSPSLLTASALKRLFEPQPAATHKGTAAAAGATAVAAAGRASSAEGGEVLTPAPAQKKLPGGGHGGSGGSHKENYAAAVRRTSGGKHPAAVPPAALGTSNHGNAATPPQGSGGKGSAGMFGSDGKRQAGKPGPASGEKAGAHATGAVAGRWAQHASAAGGVGGKAAGGRHGSRGGGAGLAQQQQQAPVVSNAVRRQQQCGWMAP